MLRRLAPAVAVAVFAAGAVACSGSGAPRATVTNGSPDLGRKAILKYGCGSCHMIPGVRGANALVGPPLIHFSRRSIIAGRLANTPANLARWVQDPQGVEPGTAMPNLGLTPEEATNVAAYLESIP